MARIRGWIPRADAIRGDAGEFQTITYIEFQAKQAYCVKISVFRWET